MPMPSDDRVPATRPVHQVFDSLLHLLRARDYAEQLASDPWQLAIEWSVLHADGLERTDVRWLVARGFIEARREISISCAFERSFIVHDVPRLSRDTAFILTDAGAAYCRTLLSSADPIASMLGQQSGSPSPTPNGRPKVIDKPSWNKNHRELWYCGKLVKSYRVPARNQELVLNAFEEEHWPDFIDDPLPPTAEIEPYRRLQATVKALNRRRMNDAIDFHTTGGDRIFWTPAKIATSQALPR